MRVAEEDPKRPAWGNLVKYVELCENKRNVWLQVLSPPAPCTNGKKHMKEECYVSFESMIDPAEFGVIAGYLKSLRSPIGFILHVKDKGMLATVARELERDLAAGWPGHLPECLSHYFKNGSLKISSREPLPNFDPNHVIQADNVPQWALTHVIYFPPFYLAHTSGLFEGELAPKPRRSQAFAPSQSEKLQARPRERHHGDDQYATFAQRSLSRQVSLRFDTARLSARRLTRQFSSTPLR